MPMASSAKIRLPYNYTPRSYQLPLFKAMDNGYKRAVVVWHRRAGKDKSLVNLVAKKSMERVGTYFYLFPTYNQGRKILWDGMDRDGFRFINHIPEKLIKRKDNQNMQIELINGSMLQVIGTDNIDRVVGTNPIGCVFSEYALQDPQAWSFLRPILAENGGWAVFNYTPRGDNHGKTLYEAALKRDNWFVQLLKADESGVFTEEQLNEEKRELIQEHGEVEGTALFEQEYLCSFNAPVIGSYYGHLIQQAEKDNRITNVPYDPALLVHTSWDLGVNDTTAIWFFQVYGMERRYIDYTESSGLGMTDYIRELKDRGYTYGTHYAPHDIEVHEFTTGRSRIETARNLGFDFEVVPRAAIEDRIEAVRTTLPMCWFDKTKCERGLLALKNYHKEYDEDNKTYKNRPKHDWSSNGSDSFGYGCQGYKPPRLKKPKPNKVFDPITGRLLS